MKKYEQQLALLRIETAAEAEEILREIGTTEAGIRIMREKAVFIPIRVREVDVRGANILKQTYLSKGGEVAVAKHCVDFSQPMTDVIILATMAQHKAVLPVLRMQPWGLKKLAAQIEETLSE